MIRFHLLNRSGGIFLLAISSGQEDDFPIEKFLLNPSFETIIIFVGGGLETPGTMLIKKSTVFHSSNMTATQTFSLAEIADGRLAGKPTFNMLLEKLELNDFVERSMPLFKKIKLRIFS